ncbi:MAG TPA: pteridine reductase [Gammaproteobacteria bacterium]
MTDHKTKVALVTGGARRIGAEICRCLHAEGYRVAVHYRASSAEAASLVTGLNDLRKDSAQQFGLDLNDTPRLSGLIEDCIVRFGRLDVLVNNASTFYATPLKEVGEAEWSDLLGVNLKAPLFLSKAAADPLTASGGCIVNIADIHAERPMEGHAVYSTAKAGLVMLTRALAVELGPGVRVNAVAPGAILWPEKETDRASQEKIIARTALNRIGTPRDIAGAVLYLARDALYTTGTILAVDGGRSLHY